MNRRHISVAFLTVLLCCEALCAQATLATANPPLYPLAAKAAGIEGAVTIKALITKDGKVTNLHVISGPQELRQAAINAVQTWKYHPYMQDGHAVDVDTNITVNFNMGRGKKKKEAQAKAQAELAQATQASQSPDAQQTTQPKQ
jgi:TonB family protein